MCHDSRERYCDSRLGLSGQERGNPSPANPEACLFQSHLSLWGRAARSWGDMVTGTPGMHSVLWHTVLQCEDILSLDQFLRGRSHMWPLNTWPVTSRTEELNF